MATRRLNRSSHHRADESSPGCSLSLGVSNSLIVWMLVLGAGLMISARQRALTHPATLAAVIGRRLVLSDDGKSRWQLHAQIRFDNDSSIIMDSLRVLGIVRKHVDRPVVGRKAYTRWWERLRAIIVLSAIVVSLGVALAAIVGVTVLSLGFLLEQAIS